MMPAERICDFIVSAFYMYFLVCQIFLLFFLSNVITMELHFLRIMKSQLIRIGNSQGIRIPKTLIDQCNLSDILDIKVEKGCLIITSQKSLREGWEGSFRKMAKNKDDTLLHDDTMKNDWDDNEWEWK